MKFFKKEISACQRAIDSFVLRYEMYYQSEAIRAKIESTKLGIVVAGLGDLRDLHDQRAVQDTETAEHFRAHPTIYGSATDEMVQRFIGFAEESRRDAAAYGKIIAKLAAAGLPPEVLEYHCERLGPKP